jgi:hypothetical protein
MTNTAATTIRTDDAKHVGKGQKHRILLIGSSRPDVVVLGLSLSKLGYEVMPYHCDYRPWESAPPDVLSSPQHLREVIAREKPSAIVTAATFFKSSDKLEFRHHRGHVEQYLARMPEIEGIPVVAFHGDTIKTFRNDTTGHGYGYNKAIASLPAPLDQQLQAINRYLQYEIPRISRNGTSFGVAQP